MKNERALFLCIIVTLVVIVLYMIAGRPTQYERQMLKAQQDTAAAQQRIANEARSENLRRTFLRHRD